MNSTVSAIRTNMNSVHANNIFEQNNAQMTKAFNNVATGLKINSVQDNPTDWSISEKMRERINSLNQVNQNVQNDTAMMKTAEGGINNTVEILRSLKARVLNAANASTSNEDRSTIATEVNSLLAQIEDNAYSITYNGKVLLSGDYSASNFNAAGEAAEYQAEESELTENNPAGSLNFQVGDAAGATINVQIGTMTLAGLGITDALGEGSMGTDEAGVVTSVSLTSDNLRSASALMDDPGITNNGVTSADAFLDILDKALEKALTAASNVGSLEQRLNYTADNVSTQIENLQASDSALRDADMSSEISNYMKWQVISQASQFMLAQSNQNAFSVLNLLQ